MRDRRIVHAGRLPPRIDARPARRHPEANIRRDDRCAERVEVGIAHPGAVDGATSSDGRSSRRQLLSSRVRRKITLVAIDFTAAAEQLALVGRRFDARGWVLGTSGNLSVVLDRDPLRLAITRSGASKGDLTAEAIVEIDGECTVLQGTPSRRSGRPAHASGRPSAEARLHVEIARTRSANAVLHTHSIWATVLSSRHRRAEGITIQGYEMLKGLEGVETHEHAEWIPILENDQDMTRLAGQVRQVLAGHPACHGFLLHRHGLYTWGETLPQAVRHVEIVEFLLEAVGRSGT